MALVTPVVLGGYGSRSVVSEVNTQDLEHRSHSDNFPIQNNYFTFQFQEAESANVCLLIRKRGYRQMTGLFYEYISEY